MRGARLGASDGRAAAPDAPAGFSGPGLPSPQAGRLASPDRLAPPTFGTRLWERQGRSVSAGTLPTPPLPGGSLEQHARDGLKHAHGNRGVAMRPVTSVTPYFEAGSAWRDTRAALLGATSLAETTGALRRLGRFSAHWQDDAQVQQRLVGLLGHHAWHVALYAARLLLGDPRISLSTLAAIGAHLRIDQTAEQGRQLLAGFKDEWQCPLALLAAVLASADPQIRRLAPLLCINCSGAEAATPPAALATLTAVAKDPAFEVRLALLAALDLVQDSALGPAVAAIVLDLRSDLHAGVRQSVAAWLGRHSRDYVSDLSPLLGDTDAEVRRLALKGLRAFWQGKRGSSRTPSAQLRALALAGGVLGTAAAEQLTWRRVPLQPLPLLAGNAPSDHAALGEPAPFQSCHRTHGVELEYLMDPQDARDALERLRPDLPIPWDAHPEASIELPGCETASPVLTYAQRTEVQRTAAELRHQGAHAGISSGLHVHIGIAGLNGMQLRRLVFAAQRYEPLLSAALCVSRSRRANACEPIPAAVFTRVRQTIIPPAMGADAFLQAIRGGGLDDSERYGFNFLAIEKHGTWELRIPDGTMEPKRIGLVVDLAYALTNLAEYGTPEPHERSKREPAAVTAAELDKMLDRLGVVGPRFALQRDNLHLGLALHAWLRSETDILRRPMSYVPRCEPEEMAARFVLEAHLRGEPRLPELTPDGYAIPAGMRALFDARVLPQLAAA